MGPKIKIYYTLSVSVPYSQLTRRDGAPYPPGTALSLGAWGSLLSMLVKETRRDLKTPKHRLAVARAPQPPMGLLSLRKVRESLSSRNLVKFILTHKSGLTTHLPPPCFTVLDEGSANIYRPIIAFSPIMAQILIFSILLVGLAFALPWLRHRSGSPSSSQTLQANHNILYIKDTMAKAPMSGHNSVALNDDSGAAICSSDETAGVDVQLPDDAVCRALWDHDRSGFPDGALATNNTTLRWARNSGKNFNSCGMSSILACKPEILKDLVVIIGPYI